MIRTCRTLLACAMLFVVVPGPLAAQDASAPVPAPAPPAALAPLQPAPPGAMEISWEVRSRFRLFREERDFKLQTDALRNGNTILASEDALEVQSDGRGWARNTVKRLCIDATGRVSEPCIRDGVKESYLTPADHPVTVRLTGAIPVGATCAWSFDDGDGPRSSTLDCGEPINFRARADRTTTATVDVSSGGADSPQRLTAEIAVRDILIAGLGDSIASGEGNPDQPIALSDGGFCFRSYLGGPWGQFYRPGRAGYKGDNSCETAPGTSGNALANWQRHSAHWFNAACHRSLYSYQTRIALALAVKYPHIAVTYLPLACTGATIVQGLFGSQRPRECPLGGSATKCGSVSGQIAELRTALAAAARRQPDRKLDLLLLSIGANDVDFSGLVADVIVDNATERALFRRSGVIGTLDNSRSLLTQDLPQDFARMRAALKPLIGGDLSRVIYTSYANPALAGGETCAGGRAGFDIHPSFSVDPQRLAAVSAFVQNEFLPQLRNLARCTGGIICRDPARDRMMVVETHQQAFADHGFCARSASDPDFDRACFSARGDSFNTDPVAAATHPLVCGQAASDYRAYLPRARWIRDANDSYFAAMTYPQGISSAIQPADIHDATWGILSAVYGGAVHPTAEGHAAMADAALPAAIAALGLDSMPVPAAPVAPEPAPNAAQ